MNQDLLYRMQELCIVDIIIFWIKRYKTLLSLLLGLAALPLLVNSFLPVTANVELKLIYPKVFPPVVFQELKTVMRNKYGNDLFVNNTGIRLSFSGSSSEALSSEIRKVSREIEDKIKFMIGDYRNKKISYYKERLGQLTEATQKNLISEEQVRTVSGLYEAEVTEKELSPVLIDVYYGKPQKSNMLLTQIVCIGLGLILLSLYAVYSLVVDKTK